jgi:hypothetical protein
MIAGRGQAFLDKIEAEHGPDVADSVRLAGLPVGERLRVLEHRLAANIGRRDQLLGEHPALKSSRRLSVLPAGW